MQDLQQQVTALIFVAENAITIEEIRESLIKFHPKEEFDEERIATILEAIRLQYMSPEFPFELVEIGGGLQFMTKPAYHKLVSVYVNQKFKRRLSKAAMETLSIIAYKQPVTKAEMEQIRGVNCDHGVQKLLEKELIKISGRSDGPGRPLLYSVGEIFMDYFGINSIDDLPKLKDIEPPANEIGGEESSDYFEEGSGVKGAMVNGEFVAVNGTSKNGTAQTEEENPTTADEVETLEGEASGEQPENLEETAATQDTETTEVAETEETVEEAEEAVVDKTATTEEEETTEEIVTKEVEDIPEEAVETTEQVLEEANEATEEIAEFENDESQEEASSNGEWEKRDEEEEELDPWFRKKASDDEIQRIKNKALEHIGGLDTDETE